MSSRSSYYHTPKGKEIMREAQKRYDQTSKGKAARKRASEKQRKKLKEDPEYREKRREYNKQ
ncbi:MAG: hypothetical protein ACFFB5_12635 [Promethearchaeota archaeon]